jgi:hypothetical protein
VAGIGDVNQAFVRERLAYVVQDGQTAHTRIEDADRTSRNSHSQTPVIPAQAGIQQ